ncbi:MarR family transcriptional regulator [Sulfobacillus thermosulfidooxidans]|uniref:MarR family transcriptional regulator n=1 Tax=Sulfobacillus thermosulfidooxidans TaxID=28034 RepID=UPI0006B664CA|nr:MarR family transcriptional regulator [Sulfobacillus thermosulfidooxidans]
MATKPEWYVFWQRLWRGPDLPRSDAPPSPEPVQPGEFPHRMPPPVTPAPRSVSGPGSPEWTMVLHTVRRWPPGTPVTSDLLARRFGVGRGQAWRWLERLEQAGIVQAQWGPPDQTGRRRKRRVVV